MKKNLFRKIITSVFFIFCFSQCYSDTLTNDKKLQSYKYMKKNKTLYKSYSCILIFFKFFKIIFNSFFLDLGHKSINLFLLLFRAINSINFIW